jgi:tetratricopeptide (TPR) repeat protein
MSLSGVKKENLPSHLDYKLVKMRFSENKNYLEYINQYASEQYKVARLAILRCIDELKAESASTDYPAQMSFLLQKTGDLFFLEGQTQEALSHYELSVLTDPDSLLAKYYFAKFLVEKVRDNDAALKKCDEIISIATDSPFPESDDDYGSSDYIKMAIELKDKLRP